MMGDLDKAIWQVDYLIAAGGYMMLWYLLPLLVAALVVIYLNKSGRLLTLGLDDSADSRLLLRQQLGGPQVPPAQEARVGSLAGKVDLRG